MKRSTVFAVSLAVIILAGCGQTQGSTDPGSLQPSKNAEFEEDDYLEIVDASNLMGMNLLSEISGKGEGDNPFISPVSLYMALSMLYNGAEGDTKDEIAEVLGVKGIEAGNLNQANASLMSILASDTEKIELRIGNSIWLNDSYQFQEQFTASNRDYFNAEIEEIDISDKASAVEINEWVQDATNNKIKKMAEEPLDSNIVAILLNAVYFKGDWQYKFEAGTTKESTFMGEGDKKSTVQMMRLEERIPYLETDSFQAVSLPYGDGEMDMKLFLPRSSSSLKEFRDALNTENWKRWNGEFSSRQGKVLMPKFEMEYEIILNDAMKELGMPSSFNENADFPHIVEGDSELAVTSIAQKTYLDINEEGTEAAAATSISVVDSGDAEPPFTMKIERPFFLAITDVESGAILFMGEIKDLQ
ncbi:serpin family protein [Planococcus halotolerans]|uniref:Serpin domain-containing protein n=1 Tax=Planococcus halotolerans TaxID=2233542 RepID=A0A365L0L0_9BACL|nr:serpin family protein [Planococcus halotolerans]RAZ78970.1 hypothetical protein DP120_04955 [Planococcus halotolerans]